MQDDLQWDQEVRGATAVLKDLLEKWKKELRAEDHVRAGRAVRVIGRHMTPAHDLPQTVRKSLDELAPRLRLEFIADASYLIIITLALALALIGHTLRIALAIAYGILKTFEHATQLADVQKEHNTAATSTTHSRTYFSASAGNRMCPQPHTTRPLQFQATYPPTVAVTTTVMTVVVIVDHVHPDDDNDNCSGGRTPTRMQPRFACAANHNDGARVVTTWRQGQWRRKGKDACWGGNEGRW
ncbi:hypothetical protein EDB89DRAFT_1910338 [Lactarius sanguifluus]|nr:hypothetical protein EDB89DRAFT_1910338 [Lactarius sanguifluus]